MKRPFSHDTSAINAKIGESHLASAIKHRNILQQKARNHLLKAMECLPPESCSPKNAGIIAMLSDCTMSVMKDGEAPYMTGKMAQEVIEVYGKSIPYAPEEKRDGMRAKIAERCRTFAKGDFKIIPNVPVTQEYFIVRFLGLALPYAPESEKKALQDEFIAAFPNAMKSGHSTANYGGKKPKLWSGELRLPQFFEEVPEACARFLKDACLPEDRLNDLRYEVAQIFAAKARHAGYGSYYPLLERTHDALSWLPGNGEKAGHTFETLALAYLEAGKAAKDKEVLAAALLFRIARTFNCSAETKEAIQQEVAQIKPVLSALKSNSHNSIDGGPTLRGWFAGALAGDRLNSIHKLGELLLKYKAEPVYLHRIEYSDVMGYN